MGRCATTHVCVCVCEVKRETPVSGLSSACMTWELLQGVYVSVLLVCKKLSQSSVCISAWFVSSHKELLCMSLHLCVCACVCVCVCVCARVFKSKHYHKISQSMQSVWTHVAVKLWSVREL